MNNFDIISSYFLSHDDETIKSLQTAGLGFYLRDEERIPKLGTFVVLIMHNQ